jgi:hypothetical protein
MQKRPDINQFFSRTEGDMRLIWNVRIAGGYHIVRPAMCPSRSINPNIPSVVITADTKQMYPLFAMPVDL